MTDHASGFNIVTNIMNEPEVSMLCGLSRQDILAALLNMCKLPYKKSRYVFYTFHILRDTFQYI